MNKISDKQKKYLTFLLEREEKVLKKHIDFISKKEIGMLIGYLEYDYLYESLNDLIDEEPVYYSFCDFAHEVRKSDNTLTDRKIKKMVFDFLEYEEMMYPNKNHLKKYISENMFSDYLLRWVVRNK